MSDPPRPNRILHGNIPYHYVFPMQGASVHNLQVKVRPPERYKDAWSDVCKEGEITESFSNLASVIYGGNLYSSRFSKLARSSQNRKIYITMVYMHYVIFRDLKRILSSKSSRMIMIWLPNLLIRFWRMKVQTYLWSLVTSDQYWPTSTLVAWCAKCYKRAGLPIQVTSDQRPDVYLGLKAVHVVDL